MSDDNGWPMNQLIVCIWFEYKEVKGIYFCIITRYGLTKEEAGRCQFTTLCCSKISWKEGDIVQGVR